MARDAVARLAARLGIETHYEDQSGQEHEVPRETLRALWSTLTPGAAGRDIDAADALALLQAADTACVAPVHVATEGASIELAVRPASSQTLQWEIVEEGGAVHRGDSAVENLPEHRGGRRRLSLPALPLGYHRLTVRSGTEASATLIVAPERAYQPDILTKRRAWGVSAQLYSLRSSRNDGIGDFTDLRVLVKGAAALRADAVGVNPLHALFMDEPERASPYSPSSRLFLNPLYLDIPSIEDFAESGMDKRQPNMEALRAAPLVQYTAVAAHKRRSLEPAFASFRERHLTQQGDTRALEFREFQRQGGEYLRRFAVFQALRESLAAADPTKQSWRRWPEQYRQPGSREVDEFARANVARVEFHQYLQWQSDRQLGGVAVRAAGDGMAIGLYRDLAVGIDPDGADAWSSQSLAAEDWSIGAPPDAWNRNGQDWGLLPQQPTGLRHQAYEPFTAMLRANMRHAGALRIDHILGLRRLFWVPRGGAPADGAYVCYPFDDLIRIAALESVRNRCMVIGEDLGTVPKGFSQSLWRHGVFSYRLLYFTTDAGGGFTPPAQWPREALASVSTHDLPTFVGYWTGRDIETKQQLALYSVPAQADADRQERAIARQRLAAALADEKIEAEIEEPPIEAVHRFLARTRSRLAMVQVEDLLALRDQMNVPGTIDEHPNWRRKLPVAVEALFDDPVVRRRVDPLREERSGERRRPSATADVESGTPRATYRLQLNKDFPFAAATDLLPYLKQLGISHVYVSPILEAQQGSPHGYDAVSFEGINPELGPPGSFEHFAAEIRRLGLRLIVDFVPNHMGIGKARNAAWLDLLEWGERSSYARMFDVDWSPPWPELRSKILVPFLGDSYGAVLERRELELRFDINTGGFDVWYFEHRFPINPGDYGMIVERHVADDAALKTLVSGTIAGRDAGLERKRALSALVARSPETTKKLEVAARSFSASAEALHALLERQAYRLASWRSATSRANYRRFFDINELAGIRVERREVFAVTHRLIGGLVEQGLLQGLRIDHIDGLRDPAAYCRQLRRLVDRKRRQRKGPPFLLLVEKILASHERLRNDWPVDGTTGYEFIDLMNGVLVDAEGLNVLGDVYREFTGDQLPFGRVLYAIKEQVIEELFAGGLTTLATRLGRIAGRHWSTREYDLDRLRIALKAVIACFPVYRSYVTDHGAGDEDRRVIDWTLRQVRRRSADIDVALLDFVRKALTGELAAQPAYDRAAIIGFAMSFQQFTAPIMAKAFEDTLFYRYLRLVSLNEVGGNPSRSGVSMAGFHRRAGENQRRWSRSMLATATHDTKRGEDARARLNVLTEVPELWRGYVRRWAAMNKGESAPQPADEYMAYQALVGAWPNDWLTGPVRDDDLEAFGERIKQYLIKALREGKRSTSWLRPDLDYEKACLSFVDRALGGSGANPFLASLRKFVETIAPAGALNGLVQVALKLTLPGVPDLYRGCELWDFSLVDPDNRRPVDFALRRKILATMQDGDGYPPLPAEIVSNWPDGRVKMWLQQRLLRIRREYPWLLRDGEYRPLAVSGSASQHVIAFARQHRDGDLVVAVGRHFAPLMSADGLIVPAERWGDTVLILPETVSGPWVHTLTNERVAASGDRLPLAPLFGPLPVAVLLALR